MIEVHNLILNSASELALSDRRLYNYLLHHSFDLFSTQRTFSIDFNDLSGVYGIGIPTIDNLKISLKRLMRTLIEYELPSSNTIITNLIERAELNSFEKKLYYSFSEDCRSLFSNPLNLEKCLIQAHFTHKYSNALFEILSGAYFNHIKQLSLEIADLRSRLSITENKLGNYSDFDRFALTPAINEINCYASFSVISHTERKGMKVKHVIFEMTTKRDISTITEAKFILPPKRPRLFIDNPPLEKAYAHLLTAETKERRKYFLMACKLAKRKNILIPEEEFDRPDLWFKWIEKSVIKKIGA